MTDTSTSSAVGSGAAGKITLAFTLAAGIGAFWYFDLGSTFLLRRSKRIVTIF